MKPYAALTEHGQARRLRLLALIALRHYDLNVTRLRLVTNDMNGIFRVDTRTGEKWILRITLPEGGHTLDHVAAEMDWLAALARDTTLSVPHPLPARNGRLVVEAAALGVPQPRLCAIFSWVPGTNLAEHISPITMAKLGELMAGLHAHALNYQPPTGLSPAAFRPGLSLPGAGHPVRGALLGFIHLEETRRLPKGHRLGAGIDRPVESLRRTDAHPA